MPRLAGRRSRFRYFDDRQRAALIADTAERGHQVKLFDRRSFAQEELLRHHWHRVVERPRTENVDGLDAHAHVGI